MAALPLLLAGKPETSFLKEREPCAELTERPRVDGKMKGPIQRQAPEYAVYRMVLVGSND
jgi:hypothetical protein